MITTQPADQSVAAGQTVSFSVVAAGSPPLSYSWQRDGLALTDGGNITGAATSTLTLQGASPADAASYSVIISNAAGLATSADAMLTVTGITSPGAILTTLYSFTGGNDGANPNALLRAANGSFYGTAQYGGSNFAGTVFQFSRGGAVSPLYSFTGGKDGATPLAGLVQGPDGNFYGTTYQGGAYDNGTVFRITPAGVLSNLISLNITDGSFPYAGLTLGPDASFYGTTYQGGAGRSDYVFKPGEVFRITPDGTLTVIYSFTNGLDGGFPAAGVVLAKDGTFYGMTSQGGPTSNGVVYQVTAGGVGRSVASFNRTNGSMPRAGLVQDAAGNFYGTAALGGAYGNGTVFRLSPTGPITPLYSFSGGADGSYPAATLLLGSDGNFYGTTVYGGACAAGTVFRMAPDGTLTTLVSFNGYAGANPQASLVQDPDGSLYGTTQNGGANGVGVLYHLWFSGPPEITGQPLSQTVYGGQDVTLSVAVSGSAPFSYQWQKDGANLQDGGNVVGSTQRVLSLIAVTTNDAGMYSVLVSSPAGSTNSAGAVLTVLSSPPVIVTAPNSLTPNACTMVSFDVAAIGNQPLKYRWQKNGVDLADTCSLSGSGDTTLVISNATEADNGTYTVLVSNPLGSTSASATLLLVPKTAPCTSLTTRHWFTGGSDGRNASGLAQGTNGILFGTTYYGGSKTWGTVFSLTPDGIFTTLASFMETNGANPTAPPIQGTDGRFYGTTRFGGAVGAGTAFAMTADGALTTLCSFAGDTNAAWPAGPLALAPDGSLYGASMAGGMWDNGTVFRLTPDGTLSTLVLLHGRRRRLHAQQWRRARGRQQLLRPHTLGRRFQQRHRLPDHPGRQLHHHLRLHGRHGRQHARRPARLGQRRQSLRHRQQRRPGPAGHGLQADPVGRADHPARVRQPDPAGWDIPFRRGGSEQRRQSLRHNLRRLPGRLWHALPRRARRQRLRYPPILRWL